MRLTPILGGLVLIAACSDPVAPPVPAELTVLHGPGAVSVPGQRFDTVSIRLTADDGTPIVGWPVTWSGDGVVEPYDSVTDVVGIARAGWTLPRFVPIADPFSLPGPSGQFTITATAVGVASRSVTADAHAFRVDRLDAAFDYGCGITSGELWCWGAVPYPRGEPDTRRPHRFPLPAGRVPSEVLVGGGAMCILDQGGLTWCVLADHGPASMRMLTGAPPLRGLDGESDLWPATAYFCGLARADNRPWCWTFTESGDVDGGYIGSLAFSQLAVGDGHACGLTDDGTAWCWGRDDRGQLGDGGATDSAIPVPVSGGLRFERVTATNTATCGSAVDHRVYCWGFGPQLSEIRTPSLIPDPGIVGPDIVMGSVWELHAIVAGELRTWFRGARLPLFRNIAAIKVADVVGRGQSCIRATDGEVYCSWILLHGGGDTSALTADVVPVPDPASVTP